MKQQFFGKWTVLLKTGHIHGRPAWFCRCDCGTSRLVMRKHLLSGASKSCGCVRGQKLVSWSTKHGESNSPEYSVWRTMKRRCLDSSAHGYKNYGGRGIGVCKSWQKSFRQFIKDMGRRPSPSHTIERINNSKGYYPQNCIWATRKENLNNKRTNRLVMVNGVTRTLQQCAEMLGISKGAMRNRLESGWSTKEATTLPKMPNLGRGGRKSLHASAP